MNKILFAFPGNEQLADRLSARLHIPCGQLESKRFPDDESYIRILSDVKGKHAVLVASLFRPDEQAIPLYFFCMALKDHGAASVTLLAPYLPYLRQDREFKPGEAVSSGYFAAWLSGFIDELITINPHLHRIRSLDEIYTIPTRVFSSTGRIAAWISANIRSPLVIGPDSESEQWVKEVAEKAGATYVVFEKIRRGDRDVRVDATGPVSFDGYTPVIVDDIISTGKTMIAILEHLRQARASPAVCVAIHAVFADGAYEELLAAGAARIVTTDTIVHHSNGIRVDDLLEL